MASAGWELAYPTGLALERWWETWLPPGLWSLEVRYRLPGDPGLT